MVIPMVGKLDSLVLLVVLMTQTMVLVLVVASVLGSQVLVA